MYLEQHFINNAYSALSGSRTRSNEQTLSAVVFFWTKCLCQNVLSVSKQRIDTKGVHLGANLCWNPDFLGPCLKCMLSPFYVPNTNLTSDGSCIRHIRVPLKWKIVYLRVTAVSEKHTTREEITYKNRASLRFIYVHLQNLWPWQKICKIFSSFLNNMPLFFSRMYI